MFIQIFNSCEPIHLTTTYKHGHIVIFLRTKRHDIVAKVRSTFYHTSIWYIMTLLDSRHLEVDELKIKDTTNNELTNKEEKRW